MEAPSPAAHFYDGRAGKQKAKIKHWECSEATIKNHKTRILACHQQEFLGTSLQFVDETSVLKAISGTEFGGSLELAHPHSVLVVKAGDEECGAAGGQLDCRPAVRLDHSSQISEIAFLAKKLLMVCVNPASQV
jgi:hypothetical protein